MAEADRLHEADKVSDRGRYTSRVKEAVTQSDVDQGTEALLFLSAFFIACPSFNYTSLSAKIHNSA